ncbi:MAG: branched-chain amino acid ABC transporter permease [Acidisphaera sp.]|nr:branched-chain amino acid ABC transporter permease [Acidisphaera sp.]
MTGFLVQQLVNALTVGAIYALIALGYTMVYGVLRLINFAHSELFTTGAYVGAALYLILGAAGHPALAVLAGLATFCIVGALGVGIEAVAYRPLRRGSRLAPMLSALGVAIVIQNTVMLVAGKRPLHFPSFLPGGFFDVLGAVVTVKQIVVFAVAVLLMTALELLVNRTALGVRVRAVSESIPTAALVGIDPNRTISVIFLIGPGLGAVAGILYASYYGVATFTMGFVVGLKAFTAAILGGIGSIPGAMLGGFLLGLLETFGTGLLPILSGGTVGTEYRDVFAFAALVLVLTFRPAGLLGEQVGEEAMVYKRDF